MLITRYLLKNLVLATAFVVVTLTAVIWLTQSLKLLELVANSDAPPSLFLRLVVLSLPRFLEVILPVSLVIAVLFVYNRMISDNELIVMRACGVNQNSLARPALILAAAATAVLLVLTTWASPRSAAGMLELRRAVQAEYSAFLLREGVFNTFGDDITVYLRRRDAQGRLYGLLIHDTREKDKPPVTITAKAGHIAMDGNTPTIIVSDGMRQQYSPKTRSVSRLHFSLYTIEIRNLQGESSARWTPAGERTMQELFHPDLSDARDRERQAQFTAEIHTRLVTPFNAIGFTLVALAGILLGPFNRRGQVKKLLAAGVTVAVLQALSLAVANLMKRNTGFVPALYLLTVLPIVCGFWLLQHPGERMLMSLRRALRPRGRGAGA